jgi:hypothetical protein
MDFAVAFAGLGDVVGGGHPYEGSNIFDPYGAVPTVTNMTTQARLDDFL